MSETDVLDRLKRGEVRFRMIDDNVRAIRELVENMHDDMKEVRAEVEKTKEIVEAWQFVKMGGKLTKWAATFITAAGGAWIYLKGWWVK